VIALDVGDNKTGRPSPSIRREAALGLLLPTFLPDAVFWTTVVAVLGTTISPYLFFWQAAQEAEDIRVLPERKPLVKAPHQGPDAIARIRLDTYIGMAFSNLVALTIIVATAATLHAAGITEVATSSQAAEALRPVAGPFAFTLFALGIVGTGLLAVPVLAGSAAYAVSEAWKWPVGLGRKPQKAKGFYATLAVAELVFEDAKTARECASAMKSIFDKAVGIRGRV
jgi:Mn2+/Fe2+ NRAMP family transporter